MAKNTMGKTRPVDRPYEVWRCGDWTWKVLKYWQADGHRTTKPYARAFCQVITPYTGSYGDMGDCYVTDFASHATLIATDYDPPKEA